MIAYLIRILALLVAVVVTGCSVAKLEARLEANPQCKDVVNPKTGATMPCPNAEKLMGSQIAVMAPALIATPAIEGKKTGDSAAIPITAPAVTRIPLAQPCKPQMNTKTGTVMPCPNG